MLLPRGKANPDPAFAAWFTLNGNGEMTGTTWVQESGLLEGPIAIVEEGKRGRQTERPRRRPGPGSENGTSVNQTPANVSYRRKVIFPVTVFFGNMAG
jgi:L-aminopeptidase/D-esterase-like protein